VSVLKLDISIESSKFKSSDPLERGLYPAPLRAKLADGAVVVVNFHEFLPVIPYR
jgi:hypothetical protein